MARLDIERQNKLEPQRMAFAKHELYKLEIPILSFTDTEITFLFKGEKCKLFPYSGWHSGKGIKDGRGIKKLLNQLINK